MSVICQHGVYPIACEECHPTLNLAPIPTPRTDAPYSPSNGSDRANLLEARERSRQLERELEQMRLDKVKAQLEADTAERNLIKLQAVAKDAIAVSEHLRKEYWVQTPLDVAKLADKALANYNNLPKEIKGE